MRSPGPPTARDRAYRGHLIEKTLWAHNISNVFGCASSLVNKIRHPEVMVLFPWAPWLDFRELLAIVSFVSLACTQHALETYVVNFELAADCINWLGLLTRCTIARFCPELPWDVIRVFTVCAGAIGMRYELRKQWRGHVVRLLVAGVLDARVRMEVDPEYGLRYSLPRACAHQIPAFLTHITLCLSIQSWLERIDAKTFALETEASTERAHAAVRDSIDRRRGESVRGSRE